MSVTLRTEILPADWPAMMRWLANQHVSHNLNEHEQITAQLRYLYNARLPVLTPRRLFHPPLFIDVFLRMMYNRPAN